MPNHAVDFFRIAFVTCLTLFFLGCATSSGLKIIDAADAQKPHFAKPKQQFTTSERPLVRVYGYGGRKVTVHIKEATRGPVGTITRDIPKATAQTTGYDYGFRNEGPMIIPTERQNIRWTTTSLMIPLSPLPPGKYEVTLSSDDGRREAQTFQVTAQTR